jgi:LysM repeat protein
MKSAGPGIFSAQAVLISLALHVVVLCGLYSLCTAGAEDPPAKGEAPGEQTKAGQPVSPAQVEGEMPRPKEPPEAKPAEAPKPKAEKPKPEPEKPKTVKKQGPVEIRIEPGETAKAEKIAEEKDKGGQENAPKEPESKPKTSKTRSYVVKRGDTLTALARDCGLTVSELAELNGKSVKKLSNLWVGQKIKLPAEE